MFYDTGTLLCNGPQACVRALANPTNPREPARTPPKNSTAGFLEFGSLRFIVFWSFFGYTNLDFSAVEMWHEPARTRGRPVCGVIVLIPTNGPNPGSQQRHLGNVDFRGGFARVRAGSRGFAGSQILEFYGGPGVITIISPMVGVSRLFF